MRAARVAIAATLVASAGLVPVWGSHGTGGAARAAAYLASIQRDDGTMPRYGGSGTGEVVVALVAGGVRGEPVERALRFLREKGPQIAEREDARAGHVARMVMGIVAAGHDPAAFGGYDYASRLRSFYKEAAGTYDTGIYAHALAMLGVAALGDGVPEGAVTYLRVNQCRAGSASDGSQRAGGFSHDPGCAAEPDGDSTALAIAAMRAADVGASDETVEAARGWMARAQSRDGGFPLYAGEESNANTTGLALSAIAALGERHTDSAWRRPGGNPSSALLALQSESGGIRYRAGDPEPDDYATVQAIPGLAGLAYPVTRGIAPTAGPTPAGSPWTRRSVSPTLEALPVAPQPSTPATNRPGDPPVPGAPGVEPAADARVLGSRVFAQRQPATTAAELAAWLAAFSLAIAHRIRRLARTGGRG